jgi:hypothetical protein
MHINKYKDKDGYTKDGVFYGDLPEDFIQIYVLGFCGCGMPDMVIDLIRKALELIKERVNLDYEELRKKELELFKNDNIAYFVYYFLDSKGLTEHGSSVPGWLTNKGEELLEDLIELNGQI